MNNTFIKDAIKNNLPVTDIDKYVKYWHTNKIGIPLHEFLDLEKSEYEKWLQEGNSVIINIIHCKKIRRGK